MKKKMMGILMACTMLSACALTGCGKDNSPVDEASSVAESEAGTETAESADLLAQIKERGEIVVAMEGTWAPWTYHDESDVLVGYDVEIAQRIAEKLGVEAKFVEGEWDGLLAGLDSGRYDIMVNGVDITEERAEKYDFSTPYAYNRTAVIVSGDNESISSMEDLDGKHTANTISSTYAEVAEQYGAEVTGVDDLNQTFELLLSGRIDATLNAEVTYYDYMKAHPDADIKIAALAPESTQAAIPVRKGAETATLLEAVNGALAELEESGELSALSEKYFGVDISKAE
ncbi:MAG: transporter substrate-binding domain-containing protein [Muribaculaceae bacterium]|nr:transporter substrate-binding domain-containing protein [Muribaculaceae bacterium]